ncbi:dde superfamily endonuclease [Holotrichia oblita]|uniref:Dde superfamily endonuclease n=1 Tax=Holotrichia oblita TaxID=644536 RepID=A0ACB9TVE2_HOLOL|nr:dde superfamily endonuclease [Holotrichia oblita]
MSTYKRTSDRKLVFTVELMAEIRDKISNGQSKRSIERELNIPEATLRKRLKIATIPISLGRYKCIFSEEQETELAKYVQEMDCRFYGLTMKDLSSIAFELAKANGVEHNFNPQKMVAGKTWIHNHSSHRSLNVIKYCRENSINLLSLPPHASHKVQPLDKGYFGPLKTAYSQATDNWLVTNPGKAITQKQVAGLFKTPYYEVSNLDKAVRAFETTGIWPYNPDQFNDEDFAPSLVTDKPYNVSEEVPEAVEVPGAAGISMEVDETAKKT